MSEAKPADRRKRWSPAPRPEWVSHVNKEGSYFDLHAVVPLTAKSLIDSAIANTGLSNFGSEDWREPFEVLVKSMDTEANLNLLGRLYTRAELVLFLEGRLHVENAYKLHPEIDEQQIVKPLLVTGQGRSGTTWMHNLLAADPTNRTPMTWEVLYPWPPSRRETFTTDPRIDKAVKFFDFWNRIAPEYATMHLFAGDIPTENIHMQCYSFQQPLWLNMLGQVPTYNAFMQQRGLRHAFEYEKRFMKYLQWCVPGKRWLHKTPGYLYMMPETLEVFPDAQFVWMHRDPIKALASMVNVAGTTSWIRSDRSFIGDDIDGNYGNIEAFTVAAVSAAVSHRVIDLLETGVVPKSQLCNIQYLDLLADPLGTVHKIYDHFGIEVPQSSFDSMAALVEKSRANRPTPHTYETGDPEQVAKEREIYRRYQTYFSVPSEGP